MNKIDLPKDLKTRAYVLRRTNYGEADRILNLITPVGKITAYAKGARKPKSKLAGAVEMFTLTEVNLHFGKSDMATITGARMQKFYHHILQDFSRMELAVEMLKQINRAAEAADSPEFFEILDKCLSALDRDANMDLLEAWFFFNLARAMGEQINLYTDASGEKLNVDSLYIWHESEAALVEAPAGKIDADAIKLMRLMWTADISVLERVKGIEKYLPEIIKIAQSTNKMVK